MGRNTYIKCISARPIRVWAKHELFTKNKWKPAIAIYCLRPDGTIGVLVDCDDGFGAGALGNIAMPNGGNFWGWWWEFQNVKPMKEEMYHYNKSNVVQIKSERRNYGKFERRIDW